MTLEEFYAARLDEREAAAKAAAAGSDGCWVLQDHPSESAMIWDSNGSAVVYNEGSPSEAEAAHIVLHDPARVLREVEAKRHRLERYLGQPGAYLPDGVYEGRDPDERESDQAVRDALEQEVREDAAVYSDHPDYREDLP